MNKCEEQTSFHQSVSFISDSQLFWCAEEFYRLAGIKNKYEIGLTDVCHVSGSSFIDSRLECRYESIPAKNSSTDYGFCRSYDRGYRRSRARSGG